MADAPKLLPTDSLRVGYPKINQAIENANDALNKTTTLSSDLRIMKRSTVLGVQSKNIFDLTDVTTGKYVSYTSGILIDNANYTASNYIDIQPNKSYSVSGTTEQLAFYDKNKQFISGIPVVGENISVPAGAALVRLSMLNTQVTSVQLELGSTKTPYESFSSKIDNSLIKSNSITQDKLTFPAVVGLKSKNLFNKATVTVGKYVANSDGSLVNSPDGTHCASEYIPITPGTSYRISGTLEQGAFYDINKKFISGFINAATVTTSPANANYIRLTVVSSRLNMAQLEQGDKVTSYEPFGVQFDVNSIKTPIPEDKLALDKNLMRGTPSKNLFNKDAVTVGYYVANSSGALNPLSGLNASDYISITPNTNYKVSGTREQGAFYDVNKVYVSGFTDAINVSVTPANAYYIRLSVRDNQLEITQLEKGNVATPYESFGSKITSDQINFNDVMQQVTKTVKADGTGDYLSPKLANDAITDSSADKIYDVVIYPGVYTEVGWTLKPYINLIGIDKETCWLKGELPADATDANISGTSTIWVNSTNRLENLKITGKNMRYPIHDESSGTIKDWTRNVRNCYIEHYGNAEVIAYRDANGLSSSGVWSSDTAYGYGTSSGTFSNYEETTFVSPSTGWYVHNNSKFNKPALHYLKNCRMSVTDEYFHAIRIENLGSGTNDKVYLEGCELTGFITFNDSPWIPTDDIMQYADHTDFKVSGFGNTPAPIKNNLRGKALRIESNTTNGLSSVSLEGTATSILFGTYKTKDASGGLKGSVTGALDISGIKAGINSNIDVKNTLGRRLGDCTSSNKTITITFDKAISKTIVFNKNYTNISNAEILTEINTVLGSSGTAIEYLASQEYYPDFKDQVRVLKNVTQVGIPRGSAVVNSSSYHNIRLMKSSDDATELIGIALEDISPGKMGRIQIKGYVQKNSVVFGDKLVINPSKDGEVIVDNSSGKIVIAKGKYTNYYSFNLR